MRNLVKTSLVVLAVIGSISAKGAKNFNVNIVQEQVVKVHLTEVAQNEQLMIKDFGGNAIYTKTLKAAPFFEKSFNLRNLIKGIYFIEVESEGKIMITPILKNDHEITMIDRAKKIILKPQFKTIANESFSFSMSNSSEQEVGIKLFDDLGNVLVEEKVADVVVARNYDLSQLHAGRYVLLLTIGNKNFSEEFHID